MYSGCATYCITFTLIFLFWKWISCCRLNTVCYRVDVCESCWLVSPSVQSACDFGVQIIFVILSVLVGCYIFHFVVVGLRLRLLSLCTLNNIQAHKKEENLSPMQRTQSTAPSFFFNNNKKTARRKKKHQEKTATKIEAVEKKTNSRYKLCGIERNK